MITYACNYRTQDPRVAHEFKDSLGGRVRPHLKITGGRGGERKRKERERKERRERREREGVGTD